MECEYVVNNTASARARDNVTGVLNEELNRVPQHDWRGESGPTLQNGATSTVLRTATLEQPRK
jgi:hypothetical protein